MFPNERILNGGMFVPYILTPLRSMNRTIFVLILDFKTFYTNSQIMRLIYQTKNLHNFVTRNVFKWMSGGMHYVTYYQLPRKSLLPIQQMLLWLPLNLIIHTCKRCTLYSNYILYKIGYLYWLIKTKVYMFHKFVMK